MIRRIKMKDKLNFLDFCHQREKYKDFYITKDNKRLFLTDKKISQKVFNNCLKHGDICLLKEEKNTIKGLLLINGFADSFSRKYMKILAFDKKTIDDLIKTITCDFPSDLFIKIKSDSPVVEVLLGTRIYNLIFKQNSKDHFFGFGFRMLGKRGQELLFCRKYYEKYDYSKKRRYVKEGDDDELN